MKKHKAGEVEIMDVFIDEHKHPQCFNAKKEELIESGMTEKEAMDFIRCTPFQMELYYYKFNGLFLVESEAVDSTQIFNPYNGAELEPNEDDEDYD